MRRKRTDQVSEGSTLSHSTTVSSLFSVSRRPTTRSIINCESLPKQQGLAEVLEAIGDRPKDASELSDADDSLILELVDILDVKSKPRAKARSAVQSPKQCELRTASKFAVPDERVDLPQRKAIIARKPKTSKLVLKKRLTQSTGVSPLLPPRRVDKPSRRLLDFQLLKPV